MPQGSKPMTAIILFTAMYLFSITAYFHRNKIIDGLEATKQVDDVRAMAYWESMIIESDTAQEKMVYMRLADEAKAKLISGAKARIAASERNEVVFPHSRPPAVKGEAIEPPTNVVQLSSRKKESA